MIVLLKILIAWLLADFITGVVHWFQDWYSDESQALDLLVRVFGESEDLHHQKPTAMLVNSGWVNMRPAALVGWPLAALLYCLGCPFWVCLVPFFAAFGNLIHRWSHMPRRRLPRWIRGLQEFGLFLSAAAHDEHHRSMKQLVPRHLAGCKFCGMTDWLNPWLDDFGFWHGCSRCLRFIGLKTTRERRGE